MNVPTVSQDVHQGLDMPGSQYWKVHAHPPLRGVHDENDSVKYTKLLDTQIRGFILRTAKATACKNNFQQLLCTRSLCAEQTAHRGQRHWLGKFYMISGVESDPQQLSALPGLLGSHPLVQSKAFHSSCFLLFFPNCKMCLSDGQDWEGRSWAWILRCFSMLWVLQGRGGQPVSFWDQFNHRSLTCAPSSSCAVCCHRTKMVPSLKDALSLVGEPEVRTDLRQNVNSVVQCAQSFQHMSPVEKHKS